MTTDIIIVGRGLAGSILGYSLLLKGYQIRIFDDGENSSSRVAAGLFNPVTGKRLVKTWKADEIFPFLQDYYLTLEKNIQEKIYYPMPLYRMFGSYMEMNDWSSRDQQELGGLFVENIVHSPVMPGIIRDPYGGIFLRGSGYVKVQNLIIRLKKFFEDQGVYIHGKFDEQRIGSKTGHIEYEGISAGHLIYCSGLSAAKSRFFSWLPFKPVKGEVLTVEIELDVGFILNKGIYIIPEGNKVYKVGSTYDRDDPYSGTTESGKIQLLNQIKQLLNVEVKILDHQAGIRPATHDRRPFIGIHPENRRIGIFNGFGSKGVSLIPYFADKFISSIESGPDLDDEANIIRFFN